MKHIHPEIHEEEPGKVRAGVVIEENGLWACPGLDEYYDTVEEAIAIAQEIAEDYYSECVEQGDEVELGDLRVM